MNHTRKKLLLREDEAEMIEFALKKLVEMFELAAKEYRALRIFAISKSDEANYRGIEEETSKVATEAERILKLVQDAEVTETEVELL